MIVAVDVDYCESEVVAAAVGFATWTDEHAAIEVVVTCDAPPAPYEPGRFYRRELPHLHSVLALIAPEAIDRRECERSERERSLGRGCPSWAPSPTTIIVDGYVWLGADKGLGAHLHDALDQAVPVIGVAKTQFAGAMAIEIVRGASARPLYVTAVGIDAATAANHVLGMHGEHRIPTLLRRVDQLARGTAG